VSDLPTLSQVREELFERAIAEHGGSLFKAAKAIGVSHMMLHRWRWKKQLAERNDSCEKDGATALDLPAAPPLD
jgi:hypothetical protein